MPQPILQVAGLQFAWPRSRLPCLDVAALEVAAGERVFLYGPSGCGKSTLLSLMAGVLSPQQGSVLLDGHDWKAMRPSQRDRFRVDRVGYIFQQFNLLPFLSVLDNVVAPCRFSMQRRNSAIARSGSVRAAAEAWLGGMAMEPATWARPARDLSVGQQQRVAAARALIGDQALVIADEPTSALDEDRRNGFMDMLLSACKASGSALVFVSHDQRLAERFDRRILLPEINRATSGARVETA